MRVACIASALVTAALAATGCGGSSSYANDERPPSPVTLTASITGKGVQVSPATIGAGPIVLIVANLTDRTHRVTVESDTLGSASPGIEQRTAPINPEGTAKLQVTVKPGRYLVHVGTRDTGTTLRVRGTRRSSQDDLLLP